MKEKLAKLIDVKSIMTLALTAGFVGLTCTGEISGQEYLTIFTMIVGFYFGTQAEKSRQKQEEVIHLSPDSAGSEPERNYYTVLKGKRG